MEGDLNPGWTTPPLPPFVARPVPPGSGGGEQRPLPPWTSARRALEPAEPTHHPAVEETWVEPAADEEPPEPDEIWTLEPVAEEVAEVYVEAETWTAETVEPAAAEDPWVIPTEQSDVVEDSWGAVPSEPVPQEEPWTLQAAEPPPEESIWTLEPAQEGGIESWADQVPEITVEPPLATFPGEAEAWEAVAAPIVPEPSPEMRLAQEAVDPRYTRMAELLESFAAELRTHGSGAIARAVNKDRLSAALAGFVAGFEAAASRQD